MNINRLGFILQSFKGALSGNNIAQKFKIHLDVREKCSEWKVRRYKKIELLDTDLKCIWTVDGRKEEKIKINRERRVEERNLRLRTDLWGRAHEF